MRYRTLGRSALKVSALCLGTMNLGSRTPEAESFAILDHALEMGVNFIDTANQYGGAQGVGATEALLGRWFAKDRSRRHRAVVATKVHEPMSEDINDRGLSARHIRMACEASLKRLGVDHIDLFQMHHIDRAASDDEVAEAMEVLIQQGKIIYLGSSNFPGWKIAQCSERARARHRLGLVSEQGLYNLIERRAELEVIPACQAYGMGFMPWSPLAGGLLAGLEGGDRAGRRTEALRRATPAQLAQVAAFEKLAKESGQSASRLALAWLLQQPAVASVIVGPGSLEQWREALLAETVQLNPEILSEIDRLFPPLGPAPEAYAW